VGSKRSCRLHGQHTGAQRTRGSRNSSDYRPLQRPATTCAASTWNVYARLREIVVKASAGRGPRHLALAARLRRRQPLDGRRRAPSRFRYAQELGAMLGTPSPCSASDVVAIHMLADGSSWTGARSPPRTWSAS